MSLLRLLTPALSGLMLLSLAAAAAEPVAAAPVALTPVLPPEAATLLRDALNTDTDKLDGRLVLQSAALDKDQVVVRFGASRDGAATFGVTLVHPRQVPAGPDRTAAFGLRAAPGPADAAAAAALKTRLAALDPKDLWRAPAGPERPAQAPAPPPGSQLDGALAREIDNALHLHRTGDADAAAGALDTLAKRPVARTAPAAAAIAEALLRVGRAPRAKAVAQAADPTGGRPTDVLRLRALRAEPTPEAGWAAGLGEAPCEGVALAETLDALGRRPEAVTLLSAIEGRAPGCLLAPTTRVDWLIEARDLAGADTLSAELLAAHPGDDGVISKRARVLMALEQPERAAEVLEPAAWKSPAHGAVSALLGAYTRVASKQWRQRKLDELERRAGEGDRFAQFYAGVLLHYDGHFQRSNALLEPLLEDFAEQPRLFIYLSMNAFDLGDPAKALGLIERAVGLDAPDPDVYYCRAEILRWSDPAAALVDLGRYLAMTGRSATANASKQQRVQRMYNLLEACVASNAAIPCEGPWEHPREAGKPPTIQAEGGGAVPWPWIAAGLGLLALAFVAVRIKQR